MNDVLETWQKKAIAGHKRAGEKAGLDPKRVEMIRQIGLRDRAAQERANDPAKRGGQGA
jgi:hypothetical protein